MARNLLSQTLAFRPCSPIKPPTSPLHFLRSSPLLLSFRFGSSRSQRRQSQPQTVEMDVDPESEVEVAGLQRRLEDAIHGLIVRRSAPEWLPFLPGSSYWVPQPSFRLVGRLAVDPLSEEEVLSLTSVRGWPSSASKLHHLHMRRKQDRRECLNLRMKKKKKVDQFRRHERI